MSTHKAKRGQLCVAKVVKPLGGVDCYKLCRVVKATKDGEITHVDPDGRLRNASGAYTLKYQNVSKTWSAAGPRGDRLAKADFAFPMSWHSIEEATKFVNDWLDAN